MAYIISRDKKDTNVQFRGDCKALSREPVGVASARMTPGSTTNIDIIHIDRTNELGRDFLLVSDIVYSNWKTRAWDADREVLSPSLGYGTTTLTIAALNEILHFLESDLTAGGATIGISSNSSSVSTNVTAINLIGVGNTIVMSGTIANISISGESIVDKEFEYYDDGKLFKKTTYADKTQTSVAGIKTFGYNTDGKLVSITGTGIYRSSNIGYNSEGNVNSVDLV